MSGAWCVKKGDRRQKTGFRRERQPNGDRSDLISSASLLLCFLCSVLAPSPSLTYIVVSKTVVEEV
jgi:hypothetical protein